MTDARVCVCGWTGGQADRMTDRRVCVCVCVCVDGQADRRAE